MTKQDRPQPARKLYVLYNRERMICGAPGYPDVFRTRAHATAALDAVEALEGKPYVRGWRIVSYVIRPSKSRKG